LCIPCFVECFEKWKGYFGKEVRMLKNYLERSKKPVDKIKEVAMEVN